MRIRTLLIIIVLLLLATPAIIGWYARQQAQQQLIAGGINAQRIVITPGWFSSRLLFPLPQQRDADLDLQLYHGPFLGRTFGWGWLAAEGELLLSQQPALQIRAHLTGMIRVQGEVTATEGLREALPAFQWAQLSTHFSSRLLDRRWRGQFTLNRAHHAQWQAEQVQLNWEWHQQPTPSLSYWLTAEHMTLFNPATGAALDIGRLQWDSDWLEDGRTGRWRSHVALEQLVSGNDELSRLRASWQIAPLDRDTVHALPFTLARTAGAPQQLALQLSPLLALRPLLTLDNLVIQHADQSIALDGQFQMQPGGLQAAVEGGGPETLYLRLLRIMQIFNPQALTDHGTQRTTLARNQLETIRRQGWLQRHGDELRADIIINY